MREAHDFIEKYQGMTPEQICKANGWRLMEYSELSQLTGMTLGELRAMGKGFTMQVEGGTAICYENDQEGLYTLCHEWGHLLMEHLKDERTQVKRDQYMKVVEAYEQCADAFAEIVSREI